MNDLLHMLGGKRVDSRLLHFLKVAATDTILSLRNPFMTFGHCGYPALEMQFA
jgi:hypothetical protein